MKKFSMVFSSMLLIGAFTMPINASNQNGYLKNQISIQTPKNVSFSKEKDNTSLNKLNANRESQPQTDIIYSAEGTSKLYAREASFYFNNWDGNPPQYYDYNRAMAVVTFGENNDVYFFDILMAYGAGSYAKGKLEGNKITVNLPQTVEWSDYAGDGSNLVALKKSIVDGETTYVLDPTITSITYNYDAEKDKLTLELPGEKGDYAIGMVSISDGEWHGYADLSQTYTILNPVENSWPEGLEGENYSLINDDYAIPVKVGIKDDKLYIEGLSEEMPEGVVVAEIKDNKAYISQFQFVGIWDNYYILNTRLGMDDPETEDWIIPIDESIEYVLNLDLENGIISSEDPDIYFCINNAISQIYALTILKDFTLVKIGSLAGTPENPNNLYFGDDYWTFYGYYNFDFNIPNISTKKTPLDSNDLYYRIYIDGELMEFLYDEEEGYYPGIEEEITEIPFYLNNFNDIYSYGGSSREIGIYIDGVTTAGVQSVYKYDGEITESEIVTLNIETGKITTSGTSGISQLSSNPIQNIEYFNLYGIKINNPQTGIFIKKTTYTDGSSKSIRIIKK